MVVSWMILLSEETGTSKLKGNHLQNVHRIIYMISEKALRFSHNYLSKVFFLNRALTAMPLQPQIYWPILYQQALLVHWN